MHGCKCVSVNLLTYLSDEQRFSYSRPGAVYFGGSARRVKSSRVKFNTFDDLSDAFGDRPGPARPVGGVFFNQYRSVTRPTVMPTKIYRHRERVERLVVGRPWRPETNDQGDAGGSPSRSTNAYTRSPDTARRPLFVLR